MIVLHIGFHKAGSTALQGFLDGNAEALASAGLIYPEIGRGRGEAAHHRLAYAVRSERGDLAKARDDLEAIKALAETATVVLSSESFERAHWKKVRRWLRNTPVKVTAYVRDLPSRIVSIYAQATKLGHNTKDFDAFFEDEMARPRTLSASAVADWAQVAGAENIRLRALTPEALEGGNLIADFLATVGLGADGVERLGLRTVDEANPSPDWRVLEMLRDLDPSDAPGPRLQAAMAAAEILGWRDKGLYLSEAQIARAVEVHNADMDAIDALGVDARTVRLSAEAYGPRVFLPYKARIRPPERAAFAEALAQAAAAAPPAPVLDKTEREARKEARTERAVRKPRPKQP